jgi:hypothetical protein
MNEIRKIVTRLLLLVVVISLVFGSTTRLFDPLVLHTSSAQSDSTGNTTAPMTDQSSDSTGNTTSTGGSTENNTPTTGALPPPVTSTGAPENTTSTGGSTENNTPTTGALPPPSVTNEPPTDRRDVCRYDPRNMDCEPCRDFSIHPKSAETCR